MCEGNCLLLDYYSLVCRVKDDAVMRGRQGKIEDNEVGRELLAAKTFYD